MVASRRSTRNKKAEGTSSPGAEETKEEKSQTNESSTCPACPKEPGDTEIDRDNWIRCDACKVWYHWACAGSREDSSTIDKWFCLECLKADPKRAITLKGPARKSDRKRPQRDYAGLNSSGVETDPERFIRMMEGKPIKADKFKRMNGADVSIEWLNEDETAMTEPIVVETPDGFGMKMPGSDFTVEDVVEDVGDAIPVDVIDVGTQSPCPGWNLGKWADYWALEPSARDKVRNVISLEVSGTPLADRILPPRLVREIDWVENFWPSTRKGKGHPYPKVQLYCLMGVASAWTDWHIDFAGSSVYYHIVSGKKVFYFIRPTPANLTAYERWSGSEIQGQVWLGDMVDEVIKVTLTEGNTMIIPTGWIHAVHTPEDTLVFGGNFLHSYNIATLPRKFRFPLFTKLCWYVADKYLRDLKASSGTIFPPRVAASLVKLADFLVSEVRKLEWGDDATKKTDAAAVAREFRWRLRLANGVASDDEDGGKAPTNGRNKSNKRKRQTSEETSTAEEYGPVRFKNFKPRRWDNIEQKTIPAESREVKCQRPSNDVEMSAWTEVEGDDTGSVVTTRHTMTKVRRTPEGVEREHIERVLEEWRFS
ncbi:jumonji superfamily protein [Hymenopellis radicata]|nr:jumonji superfamily protein [Hymenopellis radicata]